MKGILSFALLVMCAIALGAADEIGENKFWLSAGINYGTCGEGDSNQLGGYLQGILQDSLIMYSAHYLGFVESNPLTLGIEWLEDLNRQVKGGNIIGFQMGLMPSLSAKSIHLACGAGVSCNMLKVGTEYQGEWENPYEWKTVIGFPLSADLLLAGERGGVKFSAYYNYNSIAPVMLLMGGFIIRIRK